MLPKIQTAVFLSVLLALASAEASNFAYPMSGRISDTYYARRWYGTHGGLDMAGDWQAPIHAARPGKVSFAGWADGPGWQVTIDHENGYQTVYMHMAKRPLVKWGQDVSLDNQLGVQGATGNADGAHLHFEIRKDGRPVVQPERLNQSFDRGSEMQVQVDGLSDVHQDMRERVEREARERAEREARERAEREARERAERERLEREARERAERERIERERREQEERERLERERIERERIAREEAERKAREERERILRELDESALKFDTRFEELQQKTSTILVASSERSLAGTILAVLTGQFARERRQLRGLEAETKGLLDGTPVLVKRKVAGDRASERQADIETGISKLRGMADAIRSGQRRSFFAAIGAWFSGQLSRENMELRTIEWKLKQLEAEAKELAGLRERMGKDEDYDPMSSRDYKPARPSSGGTSSR